MNDYPKVYTQVVVIPNHVPKEMHEKEIETMIENLYRSVVKEEIQIEKHEDFTEYKMQLYVAPPETFWRLVRREATIERGGVGLERKEVSRLRKENERLGKQVEFLIGKLSEEIDHSKYDCDIMWAIEKELNEIGKNQ